MVKDHDPQLHYVRSRRRRAAFGGLAILAATALLVTGWTVANTFQSPSQVAAASTPPPPSRITAVVERGKLNRVITVQGEVATSRIDELVLETPSTLSSITAVPAAVGTAVKAGAVVAEVNGDPIFLFPGEFPFYRDLYLGDQGPDVALLQDALGAAGLEVVSDGVLGAKTADAIRELYADSGYPVPASVVARPLTPEPVEDRQSFSTQPQPRPQPQLVLPLGAALVAPSLPATIAETPTVGRLSADGARILLASGQAVVRVAVSPVTASQLRIGMPARTLPQDGPSTSFTVADISIRAEEDGSTLVALAPSEPLTSATGDAVVAEITIDPGIDESLIVPSRAVAFRGDSAVVRKIAADGSVVEVRVTELAELLGRSALQPLERDTLRVGDEVLVTSADH